LRIALPFFLAGAMNGHDRSQDEEKQAEHEHNRYRKPHPGTRCSAGEGK